ncbi:hypothetical protein GDO86_017001 [Hymenochirus boettgeri]|uniref:RabBD domain-containing protein n=1 Tax=Hymenochirus boettgeri TaxID=247094 RepID=A0A8T2IHZ4_9PIPI|nr:hypothetical protein GDO86_017001 [Hymenochirus boettgeri]
MGRKLDLSKLSEEEAKHVWDVVQRDIDLRKKEEERIEDLKEKVEKEKSKREILSSQSQLNDTHCMKCLQPFQFLINSKRQCKDCQFNVCKNCSRYNKKELGWVCETCIVKRRVKIGSLEWYYDHVRSRFKRFGSAKVMRSLYMRQQPDGKGGGCNLSGLPERVYSLPDINREYLCQSQTGMFRDEEEDMIDSAEAQRYNMMRKTRRKLSVHPYDFDMDSEYSAQSRRQSMQLSPALEQDVFQSFPEQTNYGRDGNQKESLIAEAGLASMFHQLLQDQGQNVASPEQEFSTEVRLTVNSRRCSLDNVRKLSNPSLPPKGSQYSGDMDTSDEESGVVPKAPPRRRSRASSQENVHHSGTHSAGPGVLTDADIEEETLKRKLGELASNISDKGGSSDEEKSPRTKIPNKKQTSQSPKVYMAAEKTYGLDKNLKELEEYACQSGTTDSELSELEVSVASAMAQVQQTESEVSDIESRIAALSAAGLPVSPADKVKRKSSSRASAPVSSNSPEPFVDSSPEVYRFSTPNEAKILAMQQALKRKFNIDPDKLDFPLDKAALYHGSLTQRNPNGKNRRADRIFTTPVLTQR